VLIAAAGSRFASLLHRLPHSIHVEADEHG
jgi:hypothetical protein